MTLCCSRLIYSLFTRLRELKHSISKVFGNSSQIRKAASKADAFVYCRRRALRKKWLDLVAAAVQQGKEHARELEQLYWAKYQAAVTVTPSGKVVDAHGKSFMPIHVDAVAS